MPLPKVLTSLGAEDSVASRSLANVKAAVDPLLQLCNSTFQIANDNTLGFLRKVKTFAADSIVANSSFVVNGPLTAAGKATLNSGFTATGPNIARGSLVVQKLADGTQGSLLVQGNQSVNGTLSSSTGFKMFGPASSYNGNIPAGAYINMGVTGVAANMPQKYPYAGSVVGVDISFYCSATTSTLSFFVTGGTGDIVNTYGPNNYTGAIWFNNAYAKGQYPFAAGSDLICKVYCPTAISSIQLVIVPLLEMTA